MTASRAARIDEQHIIELQHLAAVAHGGGVVAIQNAPHLKEPRKK